MKVFLIPVIKETKSNKIVVRELSNLIGRVKNKTKQEQLTVRLKKALAKGENNFIEVNNLRFKYRSP